MFTQLTQRVNTHNSFCAHSQRAERAKKTQHPPFTPRNVMTISKVSQSIRGFGGGAPSARACSNNMPRHVSLTAKGNDAPGLRSGAGVVEVFSPATKGTGSGTGSDSDGGATVEKAANVRGEKRTLASRMRADGFNAG